MRNALVVIAVLCCGCTAGDGGLVSGRLVTSHPGELSVTRGLAGPVGLDIGVMADGRLALGLNLSLKTRCDTLMLVASAGMRTGEEDANYTCAQARVGFVSRLSTDGVLGIGAWYDSDDSWSGTAGYLEIGWAF